MNQKCYSSLNFLQRTRISVSERIFLSRMLKYKKQETDFMTTDIGRIQTQVGILNRYFIDGQTIRTAAGFSPVLYRQNLDGMVGALQAAGFSDASVAAVAGDGPITHRDGAFLNYHLVAVAGNRVLDPLYAGQEPLDVGTYVERAFPGQEGVKLWRQTAPGKYQKLFQ